MASLLTTIGLRAADTPVPNHAAAFLIANWFFAYGVLSTRPAKRWYRLDHNVAPREDLTKYGEAAVQAGKLSRKTLNRLKRQEAASANATEGYTLFVAAILLALHTKLPNETINGIGTWYSLSRLVFAGVYLWVESEGLSFIRSIAWWSGNISCITAIVLAGKSL
ncbi:hypothetical protein ASPWEDRAFT_33228 [Aspergillus wentii DTO 134E9]|uniref:MAPEG family protein n=1 Tax=Aspergillus wentii DTO 134E9 TaxID=1073089 RepID=A0A1L9R530_ASPWE|nr:uncharacterized protein ASPWEDRAFT_33228 [Aspergillus wentii DTO 134E9]OJJ30026.1 hypothetical protein ASPWEDRAFT_33228 [Aspergillus wentii DTO 134E9]